MKQMMIHAEYQVVKAAIPSGVGPVNAMEVIQNFKAPVGFRLHSTMALKEATLVGQPIPILMIFESLTQVEVETPVNGTQPPMGNA